MSAARLMAPAAKALADEKWLKDLEADPRKRLMALALSEHEDAADFCKAAYELLKNWLTQRGHVARWGAYSTLIEAYPPSYPERNPKAVRVTVCIHRGRDTPKRGKALAAYLARAKEAFRMWYALPKGARMEVVLLRPDEPRPLEGPVGWGEEARALERVAAREGRAKRRARTAPQARARKPRTARRGRR